MSTIGGIGAFASETASGMTGPAQGMLGEREVVRNTGKQAIVSFLESQTCYSVLRSSGKVVVFDTRIPIQLAFYALVEHGERDALKYCRAISWDGWLLLRLLRISSPEVRIAHCKKGSVGKREGAQKSRISFPVRG